MLTYASNPTLGVRKVLPSVRGARVAESGSLETAVLANGTVGSIPTLSAIFNGLWQPGPPSFGLGGWL